MGATRSSPFRRAFERGELAVPAYLTLLSLARADVDVAIEIVAEGLEDPGHAGAIRSFLEQPNWRHHLIAGTALLLVEDPAPFVDALWAAIAAGSWVAPQLLVVASLVDPDFRRAAERRLAARCPIVSGQPVTSPAEEPARSGKEASAIVRLLGRDPADLEPALKKLLAEDLDDGGGIAVGWHAAISERLEARGRRP